MQRRRSAANHRPGDLQTVHCIKRLWTASDNRIHLIGIDDWNLRRTACIVRRSIVPFPAQRILGAGGGAETNAGRRRTPREFPPFPMSTDVKGPKVHNRTSNIGLRVKITNHRAWCAFGFWLNAAIVGVVLLATGVAALLERSAAPMRAAAWLFGGVALAALARRRARTTFRRVLDTEITNESVARNARLRVRHNLVSTLRETRFGPPVVATTIE
jgi:hypothetical protein